MNIAAQQPNAVVVNGFYPELHSTFVSLFDNHYKAATEEWIMRLFRRETVDGAYFSAQTYLNAPLPQPRYVGNEPVLGGFGELTYTLYVKDYETKKLQWAVNAFDDVRAPKHPRERVEDAARYLARYPHFAFDELLLGSATTYLHAETDFTTIFGSTGLFSNSHSYGGQTLDNLLGGTGTLVGNIVDDIYTGQRTFDDMVDSNGRPFWDSDRTQRSQWLFVIPNALRQAFDQAFKQRLFLESAATAPSHNYLMDVFGQRVEIQQHQPLADDDDWYMFRVGQESDGLQPFVLIERKGVTPKYWRMADGNDEALRTHMEAIQWWRRIGFGIGVPLTAAKFVN